MNCDFINPVNYLGQPASDSGAFAFSQISCATPSADLLYWTHQLLFGVGSMFFVTVVFMIIMIFYVCWRIIIWTFRR